MTSRSAANRYARALFDVARAERLDLERVGRELADVAAFVSQNDALARVFSNPAIPASRKRALMDRLLAGESLVPAVSRLLLLLADRDRLVLLKDVSDGYRSRLMEHQQVVRADVTTAMPLPADRVAALQQGLSQVTGRQVQLQVRVDPAIVGGAIAQVGSTVYDGSIVTQLEKMKKRLVESARGE